MTELLVVGAALYVLMSKRSSNGYIPPTNTQSERRYGPKKGQTYFPEDTMYETLNAGINIKSYKNSIYVLNGEPHYYDTSRREAEKNIHNLADVYNDYVNQIVKKDQMVGHVFKKGRMYFGAPDRTNTTGSLPYFIVPFLPKKTDGPLSTNPISMHMKI